MVRNFTQYVCLLACLALPGFPASRSSTSSPTAVLTVKVVDNIGAPARVLREAVEVAQRVFRAAGVETAWLVCSAVDHAAAQDTACFENPADIYVQVISTPENGLFPSQDAIHFGAAIVAGKGLPGKYSYVIYDRVEKESENGICSRISLLGLVIAHEVGHLCLGGGHATQGVMMARWNREIEQKIARGLLLFGPDEAKRLRTAANAAVDRRRAADQPVANLPASAQPPAHQVHEIQRVVE